jgi:hypothetical protein
MVDFVQQRQSRDRRMLAIVKAAGIGWNPGDELESDGYTPHSPEGLPTPLSMASPLVSIAILSS